MSYVALATDRFDDIVQFYAASLGFPVVEEWDRPNGRGLRFDLGGLKLEVLDNARKRQPLRLGTSSDRLHVVIEVDDIEVSRDRIKIDTPAPQFTSWGSRVFQIHDPDGVPVTFLQWTEKASEES
jgi:catechol 2,3-dioxygenase-like lactoylglutathione lyase family enzyme